MKCPKPINLIIWKGSRVKQIAYTIPCNSYKDAELHSYGWLREGQGYTITIEENKNN